MSITQSLIHMGIAVFIVYVLFGVYLYLAQTSLIFYPDNQDFKNCPGFSDFQIKQIHDTRFYYKFESKESVLVYYHGNAGSACARSPTREHLQRPGMSMIYVEYTGYSNDQKTPSTKKLQQNVHDIIAFLEEEGFEKVIVYGQSLGSALGAYHAKNAQVDALFLVSTFPSLHEVAQSKYRIYPASVLLREQLYTQNWLETYTGRAVLIHGTADRIVPTRFSRQVYDSLRTEDKAYFLIENRGHNDLWMSGEFTNVLQEQLDAFFQAQSQS
ncbi:MAG: alpha/beta hydrolase [Candidatus Woesearchaeota archaeon]